MSGELAGRQGDGVDNSPLSPTLPDGSEAGPRWPSYARSSTSALHPVDIRPARLLQLINA